MDLYDREYTADIINYFWPHMKVSGQDVNEAAIRVMYEALNSANECSNLMDLVPRPTNLIRPDIKWLLKQLKKIGKRIRNGQTGIYHVCKVSIARDYKFRITEALMGL